MRRETRVFELDTSSLRSDGQSPGIFEGHAAVFGVLSEQLWGFRERIAPTAFDRALTGDHDVRFLINHNPDLLLARSRNGMGTLALGKDETGLHVRAELPDTSFARDLAESMRRGDIDQMSFGFRVLKESWAEEEVETEDGPQRVNVRTLEDVELIDVSVVTFPAYPQTDAGLERAYRYLAVAPAPWLEEARTVVEFQDLPLAPRDRPWDADEAEARWRTWAGADEGLAEASVQRSYARGFLWVASDRPDLFASYKLLIADVVGGEPQAVPRGIFAAAAVIMGARGGVDIPDADVPRVKAHLERYYAKMREEFDDESIVAPWSHGESHKISPPSAVVLPAPTTATAAGEERAGKVLSAKNRELVVQAIAALEALLEAAGELESEEKSDEKASAPPSSVDRRRRRLRLLSVA